MINGAGSALRECDEMRVLVRLREIRVQLDAPPLEMLRLPRAEFRYRRGLNSLRLRGGAGDTGMLSLD